MDSEFTNLKNLAELLSGVTDTVARRRSTTYDGYYIG